MKTRKKIMKAMLIIAVAFIGFITNALAQGTLQFNTVKLIGSSDVVPANKVWKIENVLPSANFITAMACGNSGNINQLTVEVLVNSTTVVVMASRSCSSNNLFGSVLTSPIWLPAGTTLAASTNVYRISVVEFNVLP